MNYIRFGRRSALGALVVLVVGGSALAAGAVAPQGGGFRPLTRDESAACQVGAYLAKYCNTLCGPGMTGNCPRPATPWDSCPGLDYIPCKTRGMCWGCSIAAMYKACGPAGGAPGNTCYDNGGTGNPCGLMRKPDCKWTWITFPLTGFCTCDAFPAGYTTDLCNTTNCSP
jgi:hypothetical protein